MLLEDSQVIARGVLEYDNILVVGEVFRGSHWVIHNNQGSMRSFVSGFPWPPAASISSDTIQGAIERLHHLPTGSI